ncbi:hypothetical protein GCM10023148_27330 [Actinokineospora soli]
MSVESAALGAAPPEDAQPATRAATASPAAAARSLLGFKLITTVSFRGGGAVLPVTSAAHC